VEKSTENEKISILTNKRSTRDRGLQEETGYFGRVDLYNPIWIDCMGCVPEKYSGSVQIETPDMPIG